MQEYYFLKLIGLTIGTENSNSFMVDYTNNTAPQSVSAEGLSAETERPAWDEVLRLAGEQAMAGFVAQAACDCGATNAESWETEYFNHVKKYTDILKAQNELHQLLANNRINCAVLKGCAAAVYYPENAMRTMGDIDFIVSEDCFDRVAEMLLANGYEDDEHENDFTRSMYLRHIGLNKDGVRFELHRIFADSRLNRHNEFNELVARSLVDVETAYIGGSCEFNKLPDLVNGMILLQHINQHIRSGIGLRQIVDWMMFVRSGKADVVQFRQLSEYFGLWTLAVNVSRLCQLYLGMEQEFNQWCVGADEEICRELMKKIFRDGNFGKNDKTISSNMRSALNGKRGPLVFVKRLQDGGLCRWKAAQDYALLRPFAWAYQLGRVLPELVRRKDFIGSIYKDVAAANQERDLFDKLGLRSEN